MHCFGLAVTVHKNVTTAEVEIWTHDTVDNKMFLVFLKKNLSLNKLKALLVCAVTLVPVKGHYQTISSTFSPSKRQTQSLPPVMPQEKAHKQGTSSLPVFKDDSYGMQNRFLHTRLISPSKTSGCSLACSCSTVRANTATTELSNTLLCHSSHISGHYKENPLCSFTG